MFQIYFKPLRNITVFLMAVIGGDMSNIFAAVFNFSLIDNIKKYAPVSYWLSAVLILMAYVALVLLFYRRDKNERKSFLDLVNFGADTDEAKLNALDDILNGEKAKPSFVHIAPQCGEVEQIHTMIRDGDRFISITGASGAGKSTVAYQVAYRLRQDKYRRVYRLKVGMLRDGSQSRSALSEFFDDLTRKTRKPSVIIVDDANQLDSEQLQDELKEFLERKEHVVVLWIATEFFDLDQKHDYNSIRINLQQSRMGLKTEIEDLIRRYPRIRSQMPGLEEALSRLEAGKIQDLWQFMFIASKGEKRLEQTINALNYLELSTLFVVALRTVMSGEKDLPLTRHLSFMLQLSQHGVSWLSNMNHKDLAKVFSKLNRPIGQWKKLIQIYSYERQKDMVSSLHYNTARMIIKIALDTRHEERDYYRNIIQLYLREYSNSDCQYVGVLLKEMGEDSGSFVRHQFDWFLSFLNNPEGDRISSYRYVLRNTSDSGLVSELIAGLDIPRICQVLSTTGARQIGHITQFGQELQSREAEFFRSLNASQLATSLSAARPEYYMELVRYLAYSVKKGNYNVLRLLNLSQLAEQANRTTAPAFDQLAQLINHLYRRSDELIEALDLEVLAETANRSEPEYLQQIHHFMDTLPYGPKRTFLLALRLDEIAEKVNAYMESDEVNLDADFYQRLSYFIEGLYDRKEPFISHLNLPEFGARMSRYMPSEYPKLAAFIRSIGEQRETVVRHMDLSSFAAAIRLAEISNFQNVSQLMRALSSDADDIEARLDIQTLVAKVNGCKLKDCQQINYLWQVLSSKRDEFVQNIDIASIVDGAHNLKFKEFQLIHYMAEVLGERRVELLALLNREQLASMMNRAAIADFQNISYLFRAFSSHDNQLEGLLDLAYFANLVNNCRIKDFQSVYYFIGALKNRRDEFLDLLHQPYLAWQISGAKPEDMLAVQFLFQAFGTRVDELVDKLNEDRLIQLFNNVKPKFFDKMDRLLQVVLLRKPHLAASIDWMKLLDKYQFQSDYFLPYVKLLDYALRYDRDKLLLASSERIGEWKKMYLYIYGDYTDGIRTDKLNAFQQVLLQLDAGLIESLPDPSALLVAAG